MKKILVFFIVIYQTIISTLLKNILGVNKFCRFNPSCSEYAKKVILNDGIIKGSFKSLKRVLKCQPYF